ncbi:MAG TPA: hypothetical protein VGC42_10805, partial [Kofleriaceae bacterium]
MRGTLGTLLRTTTELVRGALERGAREGRARLDDVRAKGRRQDALAELGEVVLELIRRGEIDLDELPEARDLVRQLDEFDGGEPDEAPRPITRRRFDDRDAEHDRGVPDEHDATIDERHGRPGHELGSSFEAPRRGGLLRGTSGPARGPDRGTSSHRSGDGTVSSGVSARSTRPTTPARRPAPSDTSRAPTKPIKGMWRADPDAPGPEDLPASPSRRYQLAPDPHRKGGISFDNDDDLADYMHPDDVPLRTDG